jgi:hypothetical protein
MGLLVRILRPSELTHDIPPSHVPLFRVQEIWYLIRVGGDSSPTVVEEVREGVEGQVGGDQWAVLEGRCWIEDGGEACEDGGRASEDGGGATQREEEEEEWGGALTLRDGA